MKDFRSEFFGNFEPTHVTGIHRPPGPGIFGTGPGVFEIIIMVQVRSISFNLDRPSQFFRFWFSLWIPGK